jgi:tripartite-type tricarboxylate transporter receptor subunit TctC
MKKPSRIFVRAASAVALACVSLPGAAQAPYPNKPIRLVIGFAPGGAADYVARVLAEPMGRALGQPVLVENRAGAGSSIAAEHVAKSPADGYTLLIASPSSISVNPAVNPKLGYSARDLAPVTKVSASPLVIAVNTSLGINNMRELVAAAKKAPGKFNYASSGNGSAPHLSGVLFTRVAGVEMVHVPFKGGSPAVQSVVAGDTQMTFGTPPSVLPLVQAGRLKALGITARNRSPLVPDLPGMTEAGLPDYEMSFWYGIFVPVGTPPAVIKRVYDAAIAAVQLPETAKAFAREGTETAMSKSPEEFATFLAEDAKFWVRLVKDSKLTAD